MQDQLVGQEPLAEPPLVAIRRTLLVVQVETQHHPLAETVVVRQVVDQEALAVLPNRQMGLMVQTPAAGVEALVAVPVSTVAPGGLDK